MAYKFIETKFTREFKNTDGSTSRWHYNPEVFPHGPFKVEIGYAGDDEVVLAEEETDTSKDASIPITKRKWTNPANGKLVGYTRAKGLGLI
jgi:hypothetical protein